MAKVNEELITEFVEQMNLCGTRISEGSITVDFPALCRLVSKNQKTAMHVIELFCIMAQRNPAYFQGALSVASAYRIEFNDSSLVAMVQNQAVAAGAEEWLERITILK